MLLGPMNLISTSGLSSDVLHSFGFEKGLSTINFPEGRWLISFTLVGDSMFLPDWQVLTAISELPPKSIFLLECMEELAGWFEVLGSEVYSLVNSSVGE